MDEDIDEAARFFARHNGYTKPKAIDYRSVAKALALQLEDARRDAKRYRWLRTHYYDDTPEQYDQLVDTSMENELQRQ